MPTDIEDLRLELEALKARITQLEGKAVRGHRLQTDWQPSTSLAQWAVQEYPYITPETFRLEVNRFKDYWASATGTKSTKRDWNAAFRNWIRTSQHGRGAYA